MGSLVLGGAILLAAFFLFTAAAGLRGSSAPRPSATLLRGAGWLLGVIGFGFVLTSAVVVIDAGQVGVRHAFGTVDTVALLPGVRFVSPWSSIERFSTARSSSPPEARTWSGSARSPASRSSGSWAARSRSRTWC